MDNRGSDQDRDIDGAGQRSPRLPKDRLRWMRPDWRPDNRLARGLSVSDIPGKDEATCAISGAPCTGQRTSVFASGVRELAIA